MTTKKRILFFPFNLLAHYLRCLVLASQYDKDQYDIYFLASGRYDSFVRDYGFESFSAVSFDADDVMERAERFDFSWLEESTLERILAAQISVIELLKADLVIGDTAPTLKMAAEFTNVKYIALMNGYMSPYYAGRRKISRSHPAYPLLERIPTSLAQQMTALGEQLSFWKIHAPFRRIRKKHGLKHLFSYLWEMQGDQNLICDDIRLFPQKNLPENYSCIEPLIFRFQDPEAECWLAYLDPSKETICVCMGSSGNWKPLEFLNEPYYSRYNIVTAGDAAFVLDAPHITHRDFIDLPQVLEYCALMICHGGNGTVNSGVLAGVNMLCLPSNFEQEWNIAAIEKQGFGKTASTFDASDWKREIAAAVYQRKQTHVVV